MNLLAIDTSTASASVALVLTDGTVVVASLDPNQKHGRNLIPAIRDVLNRVGIKSSDLTGIAVGVGPGSYTGLRIGVTAAKTLAYSARVPLVALNSLEVVARNAPQDVLAISVVSDAQRGDVYVSDFVRNEPGGPIREVGVTRIEPFAVLLGRIGPGTALLGPALEKAGVVLPAGVVRGVDFPQALPLAALALDVWKSGKRDDPWLLEPVYLRRSAAEDLWDARLKSTGSAADVG